MGDNDRIALMQMVKEGKISTETALQVVSIWAASEKTCLRGFRQSQFQTSLFSYRD